jgi:hypothetical protein
VPEESHLDEMRAKIRADRERAGRRVNPVLERRPPEPVEVEPPARVGLLERLSSALLRR